MNRRSLLWSAFLPLIILSSLLLNWTFLVPSAQAAPDTFLSMPGHNTFQQFLREGNQSKAYHGPFVRPSNEGAALTPQAKVQTTKPLPSAEPATMKDQTYLLDDSFVLHRPAMKASTQPATIQGTAIPAGSTPLIFRGSDGRLEIDLPRGSLDFAHATLRDGSAPVGQLFLQIHQLFGHTIGEESILGSYQIQIVDSLGHVIQGVVLTQPAAIVYHYQGWEMQDLNLDPNQIHLAWPDLLKSVQGTKQSASRLVIPMTNDASTHTLTAQSMVLGGVMTASGTPEIEVPAKPDLFEASGNDGQYSYSYPLAVAPGPDGFAPHLVLSYSSQSTNERYNRRASASDEGEGFSLSLGSISAAQYPSSSAGGAATWYSINGIDGVSDKMMPGTQTNYYVTRHYSHLNILWTGSCWKVWSKDGTYFELGCTADSLQKTSSGTYEWDVDKIEAPFNSTSQIKTMLITYVQDSPSSGTIRDAGIKQITYGFATSPTATSLSQVMGTIDFHYHMPSVPSGQSAFATAYGTNYNCASSPPASTTLRCDDPITYNGVTAPDVMATMTLDSVTSYVGSDTSGTPAYKYTFTYQDVPFVTNYYVTATGIDESAAGEHLLTQITPGVYVAGTLQTRKAVVFGYTGLLRDSFYNPTSGQTGGQTWWQYLNFYEDLLTGTGARISYGTARGNMDGTPYVTDASGHVVDDRFDPLYCFNQANNPDTSKRCTGTYGHGDLYSWSQQVVTQISALGTDSSGNQTVETTSYHYALTQVPANTLPAGCNPITGTGVPAQEGACVADNWVPSTSGGHDGDWADYFHAEFHGFNIVYITSASNDLTVDYYFTTAGWWTSGTNGINYNGGQLYQQDVYQGNSATPGALLRETLNYYSNVGNVPAGNTYTRFTTCRSSLSAVYPPCVIALMETKTSFFEGGSAADAPWIDAKYTYDDVDPSSGYISGKFHNLLQEVISGSNLNTSVYPLTQKWTYQPVNQIVNNITYFDVNKVIHSEIDDASGHVWACQDTTYDEGAPSGIPTPAAGLPTTVKSYSTCGNAFTALTSYIAYDQYGNAVASVDALGAANASLYSGHGCTASGIVDLSASWTAGHFTGCLTYDTTHTAGLPVSAQNALGQTGSTVYDYTSGALPISSTDANGQQTSYTYSYDGNGNETITTSEPGESNAYTTRQTENSQCTTSSTLPCYEVDTNNSLYSSAISRTFYDALGRAIETRTTGPTPGDDTVVMTAYNDQANTVWTSVPFEVPSGSGWLDPNGAKDINGNAPAGTTTFYDALGRAIATQDPNYGSAQEPGLFCSWGNSGSYTACVNYTTTGGSSSMEEETDIDANGHVVQKQANALGQVIYVNTYSGAQQNIVEQQTETLYNALGRPYYIEVDDDHAQGGQSVTATYTHLTYDDQGRLLTLVDPDQGTFTYTYDPDGHALSVTQTSGSNSRTIGLNYDLLGRLRCEQTAAPTINWNGACSAGNPLVQNTYDTTRIGTQGSTDFPVGRLTQSVATTYFPDGTSATTTHQFQYDQRGRTITAQMQFGLPSGWSVTTALPIFQLSQAYNDADQPTTTNTNANGFGYTFTQVYDATTGALVGLSNNASSTANLAALSYNVNALPDRLSFYTSTGASGLATEQFGYDGNLRPTSATALWASASGQSGSLFSQTRSYDNAGNVISLTTTQAQVQGQSASGGSQTENFCYDEQNRLIWAGNSGTQPGAGSGTCGAGTLGNTLSGAGYASGYVYTNLGQLWQGPTAGGSQISQYLYCDSSHPHRLSGIYPIGTTCSTTGSATPVYTASYDAWGNVTSRTYNNVTATLSYDMLNQMVQWSAGSTGQQQYVYDAGGQRVLTRTTSGGATSLTVSAFGLQELHYHGDGTPLGGTSNCYYYYLGGQLIGKFDGTTTRFFLLDGLGSVVASFSSTAGSAGVLGNQTYEPYGKSQYQQGSLGTSKGYTGQDADNLSGLDYDHARYYDPIAGIFLSPDSVQGNAAGMNPYAYVAGNPETATDPTGRMYVLEEKEIGGAVSGSGGGVPDAFYNAFKDDAPGLLDPDQAITTFEEENTTYSYDTRSGQITLQTPSHGETLSPGEPGYAALLSQYQAALNSLDTNSGKRFTRNSGTGWHPTQQQQNPGPQPQPGGAGGGRSGGPRPPASPSSPCSFTSDTPVMTAKGEKAIGDLQVGDRVLAYNPRSHKMEFEPILHVWKHTDSDLIDLTLTISSPAHGGEPTRTESETLHTTSEHPFLTRDQGFTPAGKLKPGLRLVRADGSVGVVTGWKMVKTTRVMYNLEVAQDHTFVVGTGQWVVHNQCGPLGSSGGGPGKWDSANESMSARAAKYQQQITGCPPGIVYRVGDVKFDGFDGPNLLDAKGPGYARFVGLNPETGAAEFKSWWKGAEDLVDEANRQIGVAGDWPIVWHIAEELAYTAISNLFKAEGISKINLCLTPPT